MVPLVIFKLGLILFYLRSCRLFALMRIIILLIRLKLARWTRMRLKLAISSIQSICRWWCIFVGFLNSPEGLMEMYGMGFCVAEIEQIGGNWFRYFICLLFYHVFKLGEHLFCIFCLYIRYWFNYTYASS